MYITLNSTHTRTRAYSVSTIAAILSRASRSFERIPSAVFAIAYIVAMASFCDISSLGVLGSNSVRYS